MKKIISLILLSMCLAACASLQQGRDCPTDIRPIAFFTQEEKLLGFAFRAQWKDYQLVGILQLKQLAKDQYEALIFSAVGGYRLLKATIGPENIEYHFYVEDADRAVLRNKLNRLFQALLVRPQGALTCKQTQSFQKGFYNGKSIGKYVYYAGEKIPSQFVYTKGWTNSTLAFQKYSSIENLDFPVELVYQDQGIQIELFLVSVKK